MLTVSRSDQLKEVELNEADITFFKETNFLPVDAKGPATFDTVLPTSATSVTLTPEPLLRPLRLPEQQLVFCQKCV